MKNIALLGIGAMGERIATNPIDAGYQLHIWNRTAQKCQSLVTRGAIAHKTPQETVRSASVVISLVTGDCASRNVWLDKTTGAIYGLKPNTIAIESSTLTPAWCQELAKEVNRHNCNFLDAPVVGSRPQAETSQLIYLVGGRANILEDVRSILTINSQAIHHVGEVGTGMTMKLAVNTLFGIQVAALSEILALLNKTEISVELAVALLNQLPITSPALVGIGKLIKDRNYAPLFPIDLVAKDFRYSKQLGQSVDAKIPVVTAIENIYREASKRYGEDNITGVAQLFF